MEESYRAFIQIVTSIVDRRINGIQNEALRDQAAEFANSVLPIIADDRAVNAIVDAFNRQDEHIRNALAAELRFFNSKYGNDPESVSAAEDAEIVRSSLEELLGDFLPEWLKKMLKILNELLSLL